MKPAFKSRRGPKLGTSPKLPKPRRNHWPPNGAHATAFAEGYDDPILSCHSHDTAFGDRRSVASTLSKPNLQQLRHRRR